MAVSDESEPDCISESQQPQFTRVSIDVIQIDHEGHHASSKIQVELMEVAGRWVARRTGREGNTIVRQSVSCTAAIANCVNATR